MMGEAYGGHRPLRNCAPRVKESWRLATGFSPRSAGGDLGDGHISARDPERSDCFWLLNIDTPFAEAKADNLVLIGPDGELAAGDGGVNWPGYFIHRPILSSPPGHHQRCPHPHALRDAFLRGGEALCSDHSGSLCLLEDHAVFDDEEVQVQSAECGARIAATLGACRGVVLRSHGLLTVGASIKEAVAWFVVMERVAEAHLKVGAPRPLSAAAARFAKADLATEQQARKHFQFPSGPSSESLAR